MEDELRADSILIPPTERTAHSSISVHDPPAQRPADTFDTIPPTPQSQRPPALPYQILNSLTSTIGNMANGSSAPSNETIATSPTSNYFPEGSSSYESSSSGEHNRPSHSGDNRKRGYSASRATRSLSNASAGSGGVSLGLSLTNSTLFYDIPMVGNRRQRCERGTGV
jgi:hypothetical protein